MKYNSQSIRDVDVYDLTDGDYPLSDHFKLSEFRCKAKRPKNRIILVHSQLIQLLEEIRKHFNEVYQGGVTIKINSAYRTENYNRYEMSPKGAEHSQHTKGMAADIKVRLKDGTWISPSEVAAYAETLDVGGVGRYNNFTHVDVFGKNRRWHG